MKTKNRTGFRMALLAVGLMMFTGCSGEKRPFEVQFTSRDEAVVTYKGKAYRLNRFLPVADVPFTYSFENDGDLDLEVDGRSWDIDNPYDIDNKKKVVKKEKKKSAVKKNTATSKTTKTIKTTKTTKTQK